MVGMSAPAILKGTDMAPAPTRWKDDGRRRPLTGARKPGPLASGNSDVLVLTKPRFDDSANFTVYLLVGSGPDSSIPFQFEYAYTTENVSPRWTISAADGGH
jgi:hypothetical protein